MWLVIAVFTIVTIAVIALQFPATQNYITGKATNFVQDKIGTEVRIGEINIAFPKSVLLKDVFLAGQQQDTLLYAGRISVDIAMWGLFKSKIQVNSLELENITAHIGRTMPDSTFNFDYIIDAFAADTAQQQPEPQQQDTASGGWEFVIEEVSLSNIYVTYYDEVTGMDIAGNLGYFNLYMDEFDLEAQRFIAGDIELRNTKAWIKQFRQTLEDTTESESPEIHIGLERLILENIDAEYTSLVDGSKMVINLGNIELLPKNLDLPKMRFDLERLTVQNSRFAMISDDKIRPDSIARKAGEKAREEEQKKADTASSPPIVVTLAELEMDSNAFFMDNFNEPALDTGIDFNHLHLTKINMRVRDVYYSGLNIKALVRQMSAVEQNSGFALKKFTTDFKMDSTSASLANLDLQTGHSRIGKHVLIKYNSLETIGDELGDLFIDALVENTSIGFADILYFAPELRNRPPFTNNAHRSVELYGNIEGPVKDLYIEHLHMKTAAQTELVASGRIKGLPDVEQAYFDMKIKKFTTGRSDILAFLPRSMLPADMQLPQNISLTASFTGSMKDFAAKADLRTSLGNAFADIAMAEIPGDTIQEYKGNIRLTNLNVGKLIGQPDIGQITLQAKIDGKGFDPEIMDTKVEGTIDSATYNGYTYHALTLDAHLVDREIIAKAEMNDSNIIFAFDGTISIDTANPKYVFNLFVEGADLQALNFVDYDLRLRGRVSADLKGNTLDDIEGDIGIREVLIIKNGEEYPIDSLLVASIKAEGQTDISLNSDLARGHIRGNINFADLPQAISHHLDHYFTLHGAAEEHHHKEQNIEFELELRNSRILTEVLVPGLERFEPGEISGSFNSREHSLIVNINIPIVTYNGLRVDSLIFNISSDADVLDYAVRIGRLSNEQINLENMRLAGHIENDSIYTRLAIASAEDTTALLIAGYLYSIDEKYNLHLYPDQLKLAGEEWALPDDNHISFGKGIPDFHNFNLSRNNQQLSVETNISGADTVLQINLKQFNIRTITHVLERDDSLASGILSGNIDLELSKEDFAFTSDLTIKDFMYMGSQLGTIKLEADNKGTNSYNVLLTLDGNGNNLAARGSYTTGDVAKPLDFEVDINRININTLQGFLQGTLNQLSGTAEGNMKISGSTEQPDIRGYVQFTETAFRVMALNSYYRLDYERIEFNSDGIAFNGFSIYDSMQNKATINGNVYTKNLTNPSFELNITTNDFFILNSAETDDAIYFGKIQLDSDIQVRGDLKTPRIRGQARLEDGTDFTLVLPESDPATVEHEGIVQFIDLDTNLSAIMFHREAPDTMRSALQGLDINTTIQVERNSKFTIVIDPIAGDHLSVRGNANLSFGIDPSGKMSLTGRYEIMEGQYLLTFYDVVRRKFEIEEGSTITWRGDPMEADVNITAVYRTRTAPMELLASRVAGMSESERNRYNQRIPFLVELNMEGELMEPDLDFEISMPPENRGALGGSVWARLQQLNRSESETITQVFALLILDRFIADDPFDRMSEGGGAEGVARTSVSRILTQQLNRLSDKYVQGVELSFDVQSYKDYETGEEQGRTELNLELSKSFLDDRLEVRVGGNVDVEGERRRQQGSNMNNFAGDVILEYKLTPLGTYRLKAFRTTEYEGVVEGDLIETGVGILFTRDYNFIRELFTPRSKEADEQID